MELCSLAVAGNLKTEDALHKIRRKTKVGSPEALISITTWEQLLELAEAKVESPKIICNFCNKPRHVEAKCRAKASQSQTGNNPAVFSANKSSSSYSAARVNMVVNGVELPVILDSGSGVSIISLKLVNELKLNISNENPCTIVTVGGKRVQTHGKVKNFKVTMDGREFRIDADVLPGDNYQLLIGNDILCSLGMHIDLADHKA